VQKIIARSIRKSVPESRWPYYFLSDEKLAIWKSIVSYQKTYNTYVLVLNNRRILQRYAGDFSEGVLKELEADM